jgi:non-ribosomal peptide synthetase component F
MSIEQSGRQPTATEDTVVQIFERAAARFAERIAIQDSDQAIAYRPLDQRANQLARWIIQQNPAGRPIAFLLGNHASAVISILGILKAGCTYVALNPSHPIPSPAIS